VIGCDDSRSRAARAVHRLADQRVNRARDAAGAREDLAARLARQEAGALGRRWREHVLQQAPRLVL
jgi:hypothetical protein